MAQGDVMMMKVKGILAAVVLLTSTGALANSSLIGVSVTVVSSVRLQVAHVSATERPSAQGGAASGGNYRIVFVGEDRIARDSHQALVTVLTDERPLFHGATK